MPNNFCSSIAKRDVNGPEDRACTQKKSFLAEQTTGPSNKLQISDQCVFFQWSKLRTFLLEKGYIGAKYNPKPMAEINGWTPLLKPTVIQHNTEINSKKNA